MSRRASRAAWFMVALVVAACGARIFDSVPGVASTCAGFASTGACSEQVAVIEARYFGAKEVELQCTAGPCDRGSGSGTATVTMGDGSVRQDSFAYTGDPAPMPVPTCVGMAFDVCLQAARSQFDGVPPSKRVASMVFTCTAIPCTAVRSETDFILTFADGTTLQGSTGWEDAGSP